MKSLILLLSLTALVSCGGGGSTPGGTAGTGGNSGGTTTSNGNPYVSYFDLHSSNPAHQQNNIAVDQTIVLEFTKDVDINSIVTNDIDPALDSLYLEDPYGERVEVNINVQNNFVYVMPVFDLEINTQYRLMVESFISSTDGSLLSTYKMIDFTTSNVAGSNPGTAMAVTFYYEDYNYHYDVVDYYTFGASTVSRLQETYKTNGIEQIIRKDDILYEGSKMGLNEQCQNVLVHGFSTTLKMSLTQGQRYYLAINACNQSGCGQWSGELSFDWDGLQMANKSLTPGTGGTSNCP